MEGVLTSYHTTVPLQVNLSPLPSVKPEKKPKERLGLGVRMVGPVVMSGRI